VCVCVCVCICICVYIYIYAYEKFTKCMKWQTGEVGVTLASLNVLLWNV